MVVSHTPPAEDLACALTGNQTSDPLVCRPALNPLSHTGQDRLSIFITCSALNFCIPLNGTIIKLKTEKTSSTLPFTSLSHPIHMLIFSVLLPIMSQIHHYSPLLYHVTGPLTASSPFQYFLYQSGNKLCTAEPKGEAERRGQVPGKC